MRELDVKIIRDKVAEMSVRANYHLPLDIVKKIDEAAERDAGSSRDILNIIQKNIKIAGEDKFPLCQDTGLACVFLEIGQDVHLQGGALHEAVNEGVRIGYAEGYLRKSVVKDPIRRGNTNDNTPAHIVTEIVPGENVKITFAPKGFGSENMSRIVMLTPGAGEEGIKNFVLETVRTAGGNPCPPMVIGVGIGSTFDGCALLSKKALMLPINEHNEDPYYGALEEELLNRINEMDIGPQGFGGKTTALGLRILTAPTHIAGMPVAVNINCHVARHETVVI